MRHYIVFQIISSFILIAKMFLLCMCINFIFFQRVQAPPIPVNHGAGDEVCRRPNTWHRIHQTLHCILTLLPYIPHPVLSPNISTYPCRLILSSLTPFPLPSPLPSRIVSALPYLFLPCSSLPSRSSPHVSPSILASSQSFSNFIHIRFRED